MRSLVALGIVCSILAIEARTPQAPAPGRDLDSIDGLLRRTAEYMTAYERDVSAVVADEDYLQRFIVEPKTETRRLRSDLLTIRHETEGWVGFRDVYEIDGRPVRDRTDRLARLFLEPQPDPRSQAARIAEESARFNLAQHVSRTINVPLLALQFIRAENQDRSRFTLAGRKTIRDVLITMVNFQEYATPRMIRTEDAAAARGRFWIEAESGRIRETELLVNTDMGSRTVNARIHVTYAEVPQLHLWLPVSMDETYRGAGFIDGHATYSKFRRFSVATSEILKSP
jgi:hypothetical protein